MGRSRLYQSTNWEPARRCANDCHEELQSKSSNNNICHLVSYSPLSRIRDSEPKSEYERDPKVVRFRQWYFRFRQQHYYHWQAYDKISHVWFWNLPFILFGVCIIRMVFREICGDMYHCQLDIRTLHQHKSVQQISGLCKYKGFVHCVAANWRTKELLESIEDNRNCALRFWIVFVHHLQQSLKAETKNYKEESDRFISVIGQQLSSWTALSFDIKSLENVFTLEFNKGRNSMYDLEPAGIVDLSISEGSWGILTWSRNSFEAWLYWESAIISSMTIPSPASGSNWSLAYAVNVSSHIGIKVLMCGATILTR